MKIPASIRKLYHEQSDKYARLKDSVDKLMRGIKNDRWHYESRVKQEESYALKFETGRFTNPSDLEDFFACTFVVPNLSAVEEAETLVRQNFDVHSRRPKNPDRTHKKPDSFPFDDIRLYASIKRDDRYPETGLEGIKFEVQIKTFLQHAWAIATHDLIYKSDVVSWSKERIAFQVKAMLEHAEISIEEAGNLSQSKVLLKSTDSTDRVSNFMIALRKIWAEDAPRDLKRLAENVDDVCTCLNIGPTDLEGMLNAHFASRGGQPPANISPYQAIIECIAATRSTDFRKFLYETPSGNRKKMIVITPEVELPPTFDRSKFRRVIFLD
jgi:Uncharacterized protein conserved in bacteria